MTADPADEPTGNLDTANGEAVLGLLTGAAAAGRRAGDLFRALGTPDSLVLTRAMTRKYFGADAPLGSTLLVDGHDMRVTAVLQGLPSQTHLRAPQIPTPAPHLHRWWSAPSDARLPRAGAWS